MTFAPPLPRPFLYATVAALLGALLLWYGPPGTDLAAHLYQRGYFLSDGFTLWNNYWYAGHYSFVTYSLVYYPLAAVVGINLLATASVASAAFAFGLVVEREWGGTARRTAWVFTVAMAASVLSAAFPYTLGLAVALAALAALQARRFSTFGVLVAATFAVSPLAFLLLVIVLAATLLRSRRVLARGVLPVASTALAGAVLWRLFPADGHFPFAFTQLVAALAFSAVGFAFTWRVERARLLGYVYAVYAASCLVCYLIPSDVGANIVRLRFVAAPLAALTLALRHWRPLLPALAAFALALAWNATPLASSYARGTSDPSSSASYWAPAVRFLHAHLSPAYRVEAVDTVGHWAADYLPAARIPLVRGWYRQDDFPQNALLYRHPLGAASYLRWLRSLGVEYVLLTGAPTDYSSAAEARLVRGGRSGLRLVERAGAIAIYAVPQPRPMLTGPASPRILAFGPTSLVLELHRPGRYRLALRYTPYWTARGACVRERRDGLLDLLARRAGVLRLNFDVSASAALDALAGSRSTCDGSAASAAG